MEIDGDSNGKDNPSPVALSPLRDVENQKA
jgi:hypothetical protein